MNLNQMVLMITSVLAACIQHRLITSFFEEKAAGKCRERISYILYGCFLYLILLKVPIPGFLLIFSMLSIFLLTLNYSGNLKKHLLVTIYVFLICFCTEILFMLFFEYQKVFIFQVHKIHSIYSNIFVKGITYIFAVILSQKKVYAKIKNEIPASYWIGIISLPIATLILSLLFLEGASETGQKNLIFAILLLIFINVIGFQLYLRMIELLQENSKRKMIRTQTEYYANQLKMMQEENRKMASLRHDMKNHLFMLRSLYEKKENVLPEEYIHELLVKISEKRAVCATGNIVVDSILNYKLAELEKDGVDLSLDLCIPPELSLSDVDLTTILGNLTDNAVAAVRETEKKKILRIRLHYEQGRLILKMENSYRKLSKSRDGKLQTTKKDRSDHGIGLESVKETIEKYQGDMEIEYDEEIFTVFVILYC